ncbi:WAT1-related protein, partial [Mucuna pruriens]
MDLVPMVVIIGFQLNQVGLLMLFKAATLQGMNNHVFLAYSYAVATTLHFPISVFNTRSRVVPPLSAFVLTFYKDTSIIKAHSHVSLPLQKPISFLRSGDANWAIAGILLTAEYLLISACCILQVDILKVFLDEVALLFFFNVTATVSSANRKLLENRIKYFFNLYYLLCKMTQSYGQYSLQIHDIVRIFGTITISFGLYAVLWGKATEEIKEDVGILESTTTENVPLLQSYGTETWKKKTDGNV